MTDKEYLQTLHGLNQIINDLLDQRDYSDVETVSNTLIFAGKFLSDYEGKLLCEARK